MAEKISPNLETLEKVENFQFFTPARMSDMTNYSLEIGNEISNQWIFKHRMFDRDDNIHILEIYRSPVAPHVSVSITIDNERALAALINDVRGFVKGKIVNEDGGEVPTMRFIGLNGKFIEIRNDGQVGNEDFQYIPQLIQAKTR